MRVEQPAWIRLFCSAFQRERIHSCGIVVLTLGFWSRNSISTSWSSSPFTSDVEKKVSRCSVCVHMLWGYHTMNLQSFQSFLTSAASFRTFRRRTNRRDMNNMSASTDSDRIEAPAIRAPHKRTPRISTRRTRGIRRRRRIEGKHCLWPVTTAVYKRETSFRICFCVFVCVSR